MYEIEKDIEVPAMTRLGPQPIYPWRDMEIGESFLVENPPSSLRRQAYAAGKKLGRKFSCRAKEGGLRIWRIA